VGEAVAIITGASGQDGWHLAGLLAEKGYRLLGTTRGGDKAAKDTHPTVELVTWDLRDETFFIELLRRAKPTEIYNLASISSGEDMFRDPIGIGELNGISVVRILEGIRTTDPAIRFYQASSSELFGEPLESPQSEETPFRPRSPYGAAKLYAHSMVAIYRRRYGLFACSGILFNHESSRRGLGYVTRKVTEGAARIRLGLAGELALGNLDARRDWGFSGDFMHGAWLMLQARAPDDYVFATGETHTVRDLCGIAFGRLGLDYRDYVREDARAVRPVESVILVGDASKAKRLLSWSPSITFSERVNAMVDADLRRLTPAPNPVR
jgi:GDPmannose 4,6-dehydratase